ncbi:MAG: hypothetical protein ACD_23C00153G0001 [uncultured bacterium]|nr:MAG: hypothetical protein ACD_23C00153G0001 [uncultured bacterium]
MSLSQFDRISLRTMQFSDKVRFFDIDQCITMKVNIQALPL